MLAGVRAVLPIRPEFEVVNAILLDSEDHRLGGVVVIDRRDSEPLLAERPVGSESSAPVRSIGRLLVRFDAVEFVHHAGVEHVRLLRRGYRIRQSHRERMRPSIETRSADPRMLRSIHRSTVRCHPRSRSTRERHRGQSQSDADRTQ